MLPNIKTYEKKGWALLIAKCFLLQLFHFSNSIYKITFMYITKILMGFYDIVVSHPQSSY